MICNYCGADLLDRSTIHFCPEKQADLKRRQEEAMINYAKLLHKPEDLRDKFAMAAIPTLLNKFLTAEDVAKKAYLLADAMLEARKG